jgi:protein phosphatase
MFRFDATLVQHQHEKVMDTCLEFHAASHMGLVHTTNEDCFAVQSMSDGGVLLLVCDGMGGMGQGDVASRLAVDEILAYLSGTEAAPPVRMRESIVQTDRVVRETLCNQGHGLPGSTAVMAYILDGLAHVAWVGDSRAYWVRSGEVLSRTQDHKLIDEFVEHGDMTEEEAKKSPMAHVITRALGGKSIREPPVRPASLHGWPLQFGDALVLCSDGVCDLLSDQEVANLASNVEVAKATSDIVQMSLDRGGHDNITVICARWDGENTQEVPLIPDTPVLVHLRELGPSLEQNDGAGDERYSILVAGIVLFILGVFITLFS